MARRCITVLVLVLVLALPSTATVIDIGTGAQQDFDAAMRLLVPMKDRPAAEAVLACAKHFIGTPYVSGTLEQEPECLVVDTRRTDCILFVEMCVAMSLTSRLDTPDFRHYCDILRSLRYRGGRVDGYSSRLHYTSEWIAQAEASGIMKEVTSDIGGGPHSQTFSFMSTHPASYRQLAGAVTGDPAARHELEVICSAEAALTARNYNMITRQDVCSCLDGIRSGDIICFCSSVKGLDAVHVGIAFRNGDRLTFIHASSTAGKVIVNPAPLDEYVSSRKGVSGIRVVRLTEFVK